MKSIISLTFCVTAALLSTASPLGDRRILSRKSAPLARRFILASRWDVPSSCAALPPSGPGNATMIPDSMNVTVTATPDNSTVGVPIAGDNSTVVGAPVDTNVTAPADNSTVVGAPVDTNVTAPADNSTATANTTVTKRYSSWNFDQTWADLCMNSDADLSDYEGSNPCFDYGVDGYNALCADADVCAQQEVADAMVTFAKSKGVCNSAELIQVAVAYRKLPRESEEMFGFYPSTPYCNKISVNTELWGIWNEQPEGVTVGLYGGPNYPIVPFGETGSCPYGQFPAVNSCSCVSNFYSTSYISTTDIMMTDTPTVTDIMMTDTATATDIMMTDTATATDIMMTDTLMTDAPEATTSVMDDSDLSTDVASSTDAASSTDIASSTSAAAATGTPVNFNDPDRRRGW